MQHDLLWMLVEATPLTQLFYLLNHFERLQYVFVFFWLIFWRDNKNMFKVF